MLHTYFNNKVSCISDSEIEKLRKHYIENIKSAYIYNVSLEEWLSSFEEDVIEDTECADLYEIEQKLKHEMCSEEYYNKQHARYVNDLKMLEDDSTPREELIKIFDRHDIAFSIKDDDYNLENLGWDDNYVINEYIGESFDDAESAIKFLESLDDDKIECNGKKGMTDEVRGIINEFFKQYPHGSIHYC